MVKGIRNKFLQARTYRDHAEKLRTIADGLTSDQDRNFIASIASEYERLANVAEKQGRVAQILEVQTLGL